LGSAGLVITLLVLSSATALAQTPCVPQGSARAALARVSVDHAPPPPLPEQGQADSIVQAVVGDGIVNTFEPSTVEPRVRAGQPVSVCGDDGTSHSRRRDHQRHHPRGVRDVHRGDRAYDARGPGRAAVARRAAAPGLEGRPEAALRRGGRRAGPRAARERGALAGHRQALAAIARRLGRDDRIAGWGVANQGGGSVVRILHTARVAEQERFADVGGIPVVWSPLPRGAFERADCQPEP
jgi:hypothetical protein